MAESGLEVAADNTKQWSGMLHDALLAALEKIGLIAEG